MDAIEKYDKRFGPNELARFQEPADTVDASGTSVIKPLLRRWKAILLVAIVICTVGLPVIWYTLNPYYQVSGAIRITPVIPNILIGGDEVMPMYKNFKATQADLITSDEVLQRATDSLLEQDPDFFKSLGSDNITSLKNKFMSFRNPTPIASLRDALNSGRFRVEPEGDTELIKISMDSTQPQKAERIVNAFIRAYMSVVVSKETDDENQKLSILENERKMQLSKLNQQKQEIRDLAEEYGTESLTSRQEINLQRVAALRSKLTEFETQEITLKVKAEFLQKKQGVSVDPENMIQLRNAYLNADLMIQSLSSSIAQLEQNLIIAKQRLVAGNPEIDRKAKLLEAMKERLETRRQEVGKKFNEIAVKEFSHSNQEQLEQVNTELEQIAHYVKHLSSLIEDEDSETIKLGHKQLAIQDLQDQMGLTKEMYDTIRRRIQELEMERKRPARISEAYYAQNVEFRDDRVKYSAAVVFGGMVSGFGLAFLLDKLDYSLRSPDDVSKKTTIRVLGTTTNLSRLKKSMIASQIADDYLTICANLRLACDGKIPEKLVISSARSQEGKSTLAINLAATISRTGKKVLLIDGDLRKPNLSVLLDIPSGSSRLHDIVVNNDVERFIYSTRWPGIDVLTASAHDATNIYKLLSNPRTAEVVDMLTAKYDHVIIDTPPIMLFSDALLWAKVAEKVVLTSFSGFTTGSDLTQSLERLNQINVEVAGVVLNNVRVANGYHHYSYGYYSNRPPRKKRVQNAQDLLLAGTQTSQT